ncbi:hypothetical protein EMPS_01606 [Entomortierella parvispora]|uniref:Uncharacterized protein n=1 Tax=Entomortierella parvispora TaxID=205924 RepID=A0A9P3H3C3_9FUNG|nr:hypothetical protein EMPS_01606 [Entomortierella parvispora]
MRKAPIGDRTYLPRLNLMPQRHVAAAVADVLADAVDVVLPLFLILVLVLVLVPVPLKGDVEHDADDLTGNTARRSGAGGG